MEFPIVLILIAVTFGAVVAFAWRSKRQTEKRLAKENKVKSTLAADKASNGTPPDV